MMVATRTETDAALDKAGNADPEALLRTVPGIGPELAHRLHDGLGVDTLEALENAAVPDALGEPYVMARTDTGLGIEQVSAATPASMETVLPDDPACGVPAFLEPDEPGQDGPLQRT